MIGSFEYEDAVDTVKIIERLFHIKSLVEVLQFIGVLFESLNEVPSHFQMVSSLGIVHFLGR